MFWFSGTYFHVEPEPRSHTAAFYHVKPRKILGTVCLVDVCWLMTMVTNGNQQKIVLIRSTSTGTRCHCRGFIPKEGNCPLMVKRFATTVRDRCFWSEPRVFIDSLVGSSYSSYINFERVLIHIQFRCVHQIFDSHYGGLNMSHVMLSISSRHYSCKRSQNTKRSL